MLSFFYNATDGGAGHRSLTGLFILFLVISTSRNIPGTWYILTTVSLRYRNRLGDLERTVVRALITRSAKQQH